MIDELKPTVRNEPSFDELVQIGVSDVGDTINQFMPIRFSLKDHEDWREIKPVRTYQEYIRYQYERRPDLAEAILAKQDTTFVEQYDAHMSKINDTIGKGVESEDQAIRLGEAVEAARKFLREYISRRSSIKP